MTRTGEVPALDGIDATIGAGEFVSLVGPSGCGKSTLLLVVAGLVPATTGAVTVFGTPIAGPYTDVGIVFQNPVLLEWRNVLDNVLLQAEVRKLDLAACRQRARELLGAVGLTGFEDKHPRELSGGMRQRVAICRALLHDPPLLLMDEPFGALDALTREQIRIDIERIWLRSKKTVLFVTHSIAEAVQLSDRVLVMSPRPGRIDRVVTIDLPRPRRLAVRDSAAFGALVGEITAVFKEHGVLRED